MPGAKQRDRERTGVSGRGWMGLCVGERRAGGRIDQVEAWSGGHARRRRRRRAFRRVCGVGVERWCTAASGIEARRGRDLQELDAQHESPAGLRPATPKRTFKRLRCYPKRQPKRQPHFRSDP